GARAVRVRRVRRRLKLEYLVAASVGAPLLEERPVGRSSPRHVQHLTAVPRGDALSTRYVCERPLLIETRSTSELDDGCAVGGGDARNVCTQIAIYVPKSVEPAAHGFGAKL